MDPRLGTLDKKITCATCFSVKYEECPGHFGVIDLAQPVYHISMKNFVKKVLTCVCFNCSALLVKTDDPRFIDIKRTNKPQARLTKLERLCKTVKMCHASEDPETRDEEEREGLKVAMMIDNPELTRQTLDELSDRELKKMADQMGVNADRWALPIYGCGQAVPKGYTWDNSDPGGRMMIKWEATGDRPAESRQLKAQEAFDILRKLDDETAKMLGFTP